MAGNSGGALEGMVVIDLTRMLAGPYCTMMLADQGADVVKIEPPGGDGTRGMGPWMADDELHAYGGYFQSINRNKRSMVLDLKPEEGKDILRRMVAKGDVLVENYRAGVMDRLGLSYEALSEINPKLVYAAIRGFGDPRTCDSPSVDWPAFDVVAQGMGGLIATTGHDDDHPVKAGPGLGDIMPAMFAAFGILAAKQAADRTGVGQFLDVSMADGVLATCERAIYMNSYTGVVQGPEPSHPLICPFGSFRCKDGWVTIATPGEVFWTELCETMGRPELGDDERYRNNLARLERVPEVIALIEEWTLQYTKAELTDLLGGKIPYGPVLDAAGIMADPHMIARQALVEVEQPGSAKKAVITNTPIRMTETPGGVWRRAPIKGEHTDEILERFGISAGEISKARASGTVA